MKKEQKKKCFVAAEDTDVYNVLTIEDFDADGYLYGHGGEDGYTLDDFDVVGWFDTMDEAFEWVDEHESY